MAKEKISFRNHLIIEKELNQVKEDRTKLIRSILDDKGSNWDSIFNSDEYKFLNKKETELEKELYASKNYNVEVGDGITLCVYTDCHAYTIIKRTSNTITIQQDKATLKKDFKPVFIVGGFAGHCVNQEEQDYDYERDENGRIFILHWSKKYNKWNAPKGYSSAFIGRHEYYDYNF